MLYPCIPSLVVIEMIGQELDFPLRLLLLLLSCCALIGDLRGDKGNNKLITERAFNHRDPDTEMKLFVRPRPYPSDFH